ncbi:hypothetical protein KUV57_13070 [Epibacterium sp. DP7N7-1]|nr:hypothetical protein [Epibacterium sp. DP7N7-1]
MTYIFSLFYMASISLTALGFISATSDEGDFLNIGLNAHAWGLVTVVAAAVAVVSLANMKGRISYTSHGFTKVFFIGLFLAHCLTVIASLVPAALVVMAMIAGHITLAGISSIVAMAILVIPMTPLAEALEDTVAV